MRVEHYLNSISNSVSYIIFDDINADCWLVDVGDFQSLCSIIEGFNLKGVFLTHIHYDHIYGLNEVLNLFPNTLIYTNSFGLQSLNNPVDNLSSFYGTDYYVSEKAKIVEVKNNDLISLGEDVIRVLETPGHDNSCLSFLLDKWLFTGDSYIKGCKVFTKFQNSDKVQAEKSLLLLQQLENNGCVVLSGHIGC